MGGHSLVFDFDCDHVVIRAVCNAEPDADCRLVCFEDCEAYSTIHRHEDETFDGQVVKRYTHDDCNAGMRPADCNVCLFLNESDCIDESGVDLPRFEIGRVAIEPVWQGDYFDWKLAADV